MVRATFGTDEKEMPSYVGPHNGRELALMLAGRKPLAKFVKELAVGDYEIGDEGRSSRVAKY